MIFQNCFVLAFVTRIHFDRHPAGKIGYIRFTHFPIPDFCIFFVLFSLYLYFHDLSIKRKTYLQGEIHNGNYKINMHYTWTVIYSNAHYLTRISNATYTFCITSHGDYIHTACVHVLRIVLFQEILSMSNFYILRTIFTENSKSNTMNW